MIYKKYIKEIVVVAFVFVMAIALTGCGKETGTNTGGSNNETKPISSNGKKC